MGKVMVYLKVREEKHVSRLTFDDIVRIRNHRFSNGSDADSTSGSVTLDPKFL